MLLLNQQSTLNEIKYWNSQKMTAAIKKVIILFDMNVNVKMRLNVWQHIIIKFDCILNARKSFLLIISSFFLEENDECECNSKINKKIFELKNITVLSYLNTFMLDHQTEWSFKTFQLNYRDISSILFQLEIFCTANAQWHIIFSVFALMSWWIQKLKDLFMNNNIDVDECMSDTTEKSIQELSTLLPHLCIILGLSFPISLTLKQNDLLFSFIYVIY